MIIKVTQQHIDKGVAYECSKCPIALALTDMGFKDVMVRFNRINAVGLKLTTTDAMRAFMSKFDVGDLFDSPVQPCEFIV
jgi:hypothetical protein